MSQNTVENNNQNRNRNTSTPERHGDCYCEPDRFCCFNKFIQIENLVALVGFFDGMVYLFLAVICGFLLLMWEMNGKHKEKRGFTKPSDFPWKFFMEPNEDGLYLLLASYLVASIAGWTLGFRYKYRHRCAAVCWMLSMIYVTALQAICIYYFPFYVNLGNIGLIAIRLYEFWIVYHWDRVIRSGPPVEIPQTHPEGQGQSGQTMSSSSTKHHHGHHHSHTHSHSYDQYSQNIHTSRQSQNY